VGERFTFSTVPIVAVRAAAVKMPLMMVWSVLSHWDDHVGCGSELNLKYQKNTNNDIRITKKLRYNLNKKNLLNKNDHQ
jgi:hypothetical protein